jgi:transcriptional regulator with XRE-family HTH domain
MDSIYLQEYKLNLLFSELCYKCEYAYVTFGNNIVVTFVIKDFAMKERLIQLLDLEQLSPSKFADIIGVQRSSISHVISGRNKPSFDFLQKTLKAFPGLNASWLMLGEGTMYEQMGRNISGNLFDAPVAPEEPSQDHISSNEEDHTGLEAAETPITSEPEREKVLESPTPAQLTETSLQEETLKEIAKGGTKRIVQVMVIYEDDTFKALLPSH